MAHVLVVELLGEELVLLAHLRLGAHVAAVAGRTRTAFGRRRGRVVGPDRGRPRPAAGTDAVFSGPAERPAMRVRGRRECRDCGERWSYFETGAVECPACGSVLSVAVDDERRLHTAGPADLDLAAARAAVGDRPLREVADLAAAATRSYLAAVGFVDAGELRPLDDRTVAAAELRQVADRVRRSLVDDEAVEHHLLALLRGAPDGERPDDVPAALRGARGLGVAAAVDRYRADVARYLDEHPDPAARRVLGTLRDRLRRVEALDGDVPPAEAERLVAAARELGAYVGGEADEAALARAEDRLTSA